MERKNWMDPREEVGGKTNFFFSASLGKAATGAVSGRP